MRWLWSRTRKALLTILVVVLVGTGALVLDARARPVRAAGPPQGAAIGAHALRHLRFEVASTRGMRAIVVRLDGHEVAEDVARTDTSVVYVPQGLPEGDHEVEIEYRSGLWPRPRTETWAFTVDTTPPQLRVTQPTAAVPRDEPVQLEGESEDDAQVRIDGKPVPLSSGAFTLELATPPDRPLRIVAIDPAGNRTRVMHQVRVAAQLEGPIRAVHVSPHAWFDKPYRKGVIRLVEEGRINAIQLDLKHESGIIGYRSKVPLARRAGATTSLYDLENAVKRIHGLGVPVIGRIVAFRDPILADHSWATEKRERVIQNADGTRYASYGGFTNPANEDVRRYNIDIAEEAAAAGVDHILYDYVRRPDAPLSALRLPGLEGDVEEAVALLMRQTRVRLEPYGTILGASVYGIAVTRPSEISQNIPLIAREVDYVAPMLYPSHWGPGEYGVADPARQPYEIIKRSLRDFLEAVEGTDAQIIPWLQDFTIDGVFYGPEQVRAQIRAAEDVGVDSWILWDAGVTYTAAALDPLPAD